MATGPDVLYLAVGDIDLAFTTMGERENPPVLLVAGLGAQLISWEDEFCAELVDRGLFVIRYDNRDVGLSTHFDDMDATPAPAPATRPLPPPAYALADLAADAAGLIDNLGLGSAHVVGASMGGMIGQLLAIEHPERVRSLTSIMSTTGDPQVGQATDAAMAVLLAPPGNTRQELLDEVVASRRILGSPAYPVAEHQLRERAARAFDRAYYPAGFDRQLQACLTTPDRTEALRRLEVPALVIHGADDQLIGVSGGRATAAAIPGAELLVIDGMGHDLPEPLWPVVAERIAELVGLAEAHGRR